MSKADEAVAPACFPMKNLFGSKDHRSFAERTSPRLDGKVAVITGAATGVGAATARLFASQGARVIIADVEADAGKKLSSELGTVAHFVRCDVTKEADVAAAVDYAVKCWGRLDIMFSNAGIADPLGGLATVDIEEFDKVMGVHVKGAVLGAKHASRVMIPAGKGVILFSGSTSGKEGGAGARLHSAANAAVLGIVRSAAAELGQHGIRVNAVSSHCVATPTSIATAKAAPELADEHVEKAPAASGELDVLITEKVASAVMFLASDDAGFISGHNLVLDGGYSVTKPPDASQLKAALKKSESARTESPMITPIAGSSSLSASMTKARQTEDRAREKEEKAAGKERAKKEKGQQREREKREKERKVQEKARAAKAAKQEAKESKTRPDNNEIDIHPLEEKALAKEERIREETGGPPNAGPEPDILYEFRSRPPVKKIGSLFGRKKDVNKEETNDSKPSGPPGKGKKEEKPNDPGKVSKKDGKKEDKASDPGEGPAKEAKSSTENGSTAASLSKQSSWQRLGSFLSPRKKDETVSGPQDTASEGGKNSSKQKSEGNSADPKTKAKPPGKEKKVRPWTKGARKKTQPSPAITPEPEPKQSSPLAKVGSLLWGIDPTNKVDKLSADPGKVSKK